MQRADFEHCGFQAYPPMSGPDLFARLHGLLDRARRHIQAGECREAFRLLGTPLSALRNTAEASGVMDMFTTAARNHPLLELVHQDPYTRRAFEKPRGYAGDAVMLDYVYDAIPPPGTTAIGRRCFHATTRSSMGLSVIYRRAVLRAHIDHVVASRERCRILSVASGHCRELDGSLFAEASCQGEYLAYDQDRESCARVRRTFRGLAVTALAGEIRHLMTRRSDLGDFDLIYTAGLLDYLTTGIAKRLVASLIAMLRPEGRLVLANFVPGCIGRGYMHTMMDWRLLYRREQELRALFPRRLANRVLTSLDPHGNVAYGELHLGSVHPETPSMAFPDTLRAKRGLALAPFINGLRHR